MTLYYYTTFEYALSNIQNRHIKVATLDSVNDPFEWVPCIINSSTNKPFPAEWVRKWMCDRYKNQFGFLCFTKKIADSAFWAYYGDKHKGIAFGFKFDEDYLPLEINYMKKRATISSEELETATEKGKLDPYFNTLISCKSDSWQHEEEYRLLVQLQHTAYKNKELWFVSMNGRLNLKEMRCGSQCSEQQIIDIKKELGLNGFAHVQVIKTKMSDIDFCIETPQDS